MKIYGKESDYYDSALVFGQDPLCKWTRKFTVYEGKVIGTGKIESPLPGSFFGNGHYLITYHKRVEGKLRSCFNFCKQIRHDVYEFSSGYVFFCGKTYPFIQCKKSGVNRISLHDHITFYSSDKLFKYLTDENISHTIPDTCKAQFRFQRKVNKKQLREWFEQEMDCEEIHRVSNIPVYIVSTSGLEEGGRLKDYQFAKVFDPYTCLQELEMYISGVLGGTSPVMIEISDVDKLVGKGFDKKMSFRKRKGG